MKFIILSLLVFFSFAALSQQKIDSLDTIPVLSMKDLREITISLQDLPAKDWLKVCQVIDKVYFRKLEQINGNKQKKEPESKRDK